jgi:CO dehydrogenase nickel-insertion accessory protein CooC1
MAKKKKKGRFSVKNFISGGILTEEFVSRQLKLLVLIVFLFIVIITNSYTGMRELTKIAELKEQLKDVKYEYLVISTQLTSSSRQSQVEALLKKEGIELSRPTTPAFEIHK